MVASADCAGWSTPRLRALICRCNDPLRRQLRGIGQQRGAEQPVARPLELFVEADKEREHPQPTRVSRASSQV